MFSVSRRIDKNVFKILRKKKMKSNKISENIVSKALIDNEYPQVDK